MENEQILDAVELCQMLHDVNPSHCVSANKDVSNDEFHKLMVCRKCIQTLKAWKRGVVSQF